MSTSTSINRRNLVKGAAWAAPAVLTSVTVPAYAASKKGTSTTTAGKYYHTLYSKTPATCNPTTSPQYGYIDTMATRSPAGNGNSYRDPASSNGYWVEGTSGTVTNVSITTTYTFNHAIKLDATSTYWGANIIPAGWTVTQTSSTTIKVTYTAATWNVSTSVSGSGDATGFFLNFHVTDGCYANGGVTVSSSTTMTYYDATGLKTYTKPTGPSGI